MTQHPHPKLSREKIITVFVVTAILTVILFGLFSGTPIEKYAPKNSDEAQIISLIKKFEIAKTEKNLEAYLACLSDHGRFMFGGGGLMVSKAELVRLLPKFWADLESGDLSVRANSRESLNGNFRDGSFFDPVIKVENQTAKVAVTFKTPIIKWTTLLFIDLIKKNGVWQIIRFEWDMG